MAVTASVGRVPIAATTLRLRLPERVMAEARRAAADCGLPFEAWTAEVVEAYLAHERCRHAVRQVAEVGGDTDIAAPPIEIRPSDAQPTPCGPADGPQA